MALDILLVLISAILLLVFLSVVIMGLATSYQQFCERLLRGKAGRPQT